MFRNRKYYSFDVNELTRRIRRLFEGNLNYRKLLLLLFTFAIIILYIGPYIFSWLFGTSTKYLGKRIGFLFLHSHIATHSIVFCFSVKI